MWDQWELEARTSRILVQYNLTEQEQNKLLHEFPCKKECLLELVNTIDQGSQRDTLLLIASVMNFTRQ